MSFATTLEHLALGQNLTRIQAQESFDSMFSGTMSPAQSGALLLGLRAKGETADELSAAVQAALKQARHIRHQRPRSIDTCGTGGDGKKSFNCSTAVALFLAQMGYTVVKHGNKAVSGNCGSADVIDHFNIPFVQDESDVPGFLDRANFVFLFAQHFHPAFGSIAPIRKELGIPTLFNLMGPLLNPARPTHQLLGVGRRSSMDIVAQALAMSDIEHGVVVHGAEGFDELTPCGPAEVVYVHQGRCRPAMIDPSSLGIRPCPPQDLCYPDKSQALEVMKAVLSGQGPEPVLDMVALNLALAVHILEDELALDRCLDLARSAIRQGIDLGRFHA